MYDVFCLFLIVALNLFEFSYIQSLFFIYNIYRTRVLRHMASELNLNIRSDGYVRVLDLLKLNMKTFANIPLRAHTVDDIREVGSSDFSLLYHNFNIFSYVFIILHIIK